MESMKLHRTRKICYVILLVFFGSGDYLICQKINFGKIFNPIMMTIIMYIAECLCILFTFCRNKILILSSNLIINPEVSGNAKNCYSRYRNYCFIVPSLLEFLESIFSFVCFAYLQSGVIASFEMLKTLFIWVYRYKFVNRSFFFHEKIGLAIYFLGMTTALIGTIIFQETKIEGTSGYLLTSLLILCVILNAFTLITQEKIMNELNTSPAKVNAIKGCFGLALSVIFYVPVVMLFEKLFGNSEHLTKPFEQLFTDSTIVILSFSYMVSLIFYNYYNVVFLKFTDSFTVSTIGSGRMLITWLYLVINQQKFTSTVIFNILGSILVIAGLLIYNAVIVPPTDKFKESVDESIKNNTFYQKYMDKPKSFIFFKSNLILAE